MLVACPIKRQKFDQSQQSTCFEKVADDFSLCVHKYSKSRLIN